MYFHRTTIEFFLSFFYFPFISSSCSSYQHPSGVAVDVKRGWKKLGGEGGIYTFPRRRVIVHGAANFVASAVDGSRHFCRRNSTCILPLPVPSASPRWAPRDQHTYLPRSRNPAEPLLLHRLDSLQLRCQYRGVRSLMLAMVAPSRRSMRNRCRR